MLDAVQNAIVSAIRKGISLERVSTIYLIEVPAEFERPSFFLYPATPLRGEAITTGLRQYDESWQIVYFPQLDAFGNEDRGDLMAMGTMLEGLFGLSDALLGIPDLPFGPCVAQITGFSYEMRDGVGYGSLQFSFFLRKAEAHAPTLGELDLTMQRKG